MQANTSPTLVLSVRRRRSPPGDPLKKITVQLSESVVDAIKALVDSGEAASANVFVEDAVRASLRERRRARIYAAYEDASRDPVFMREMNTDLAAFEVTVADGIPPDR